MDNKFLKLRHPFNCFVAGSSGSGKTVLIRNILKNWNDAFHNLPTNSQLEVTWIYGQQQPLYKIPIKNNVNVKYTNKFPTYSQLEVSRPHIIVIDDLMNELANNETLASLFTKGSHHLNISVFFIVQNMFAQGRQMRNISLNAHYIILMQNARDKSQINTLARQVMPENKKLFLEIFKLATSRPFGYLLIDLKNDSPDKIRFRTRITTDELPFNIKHLNHVPIVYHHGL